MKVLREFSRVFVGLVFVFSGFVKGVDPLGTVYRIEDYFIAYGTEWAIPMALFFSVFLCTLEFTLGVVMVLNIRVKQFAWILFSMMIFFTIVTFYDALYNPVPDCGCFGDAITLTNWATFYKNIFLMIFTSIIFFRRKKMHGKFPPRTGTMIVVFVFIAFGWFSVYNYNHLPVIDFRAWKVGNDMAPDNEEAVKVFVTYKNIKTGEEKEFLSPNYPWNDSVWITEWEFIDQRMDDNNLFDGFELKIEDIYGDDYTKHYLENQDYQFIIVAYDLEKTDKEAFQKINDLYQKTEEKGYSLIVLTSEIPDNIDKFKKELNVEYEFYFADDVALETMVRANPGLILMKDGIVLNKWHYNDFPNYSELEEEFPELL